MSHDHSSIIFEITSSNSAVILNVSLDQLKVMSAIERCRTAELGGHVARCENANCSYTQIAYNSLYGALDVKH